MEQNSPRVATEIIKDGTSIGARYTPISPPTSFIADTVNPTAEATNTIYVRSNDVNSSENSAYAVSNLLFNIPINGYYTIYFDSLSKLVNMVGGVRVNVPADANDTQFANIKGTSAVLDGTKAISFLRMRNDSNAPREERHKEFISSFINSAKSAVKKDLSLPVKIANKLSNESVTNIDISGMLYLATEALNWETEFINISGEYSVENNLEVFTVDGEKLKDTVIDNFYITEK